jgi:hypothetical protein
MNVNPYAFTSNFRPACQWTDDTLTGSTGVFSFWAERMRKTPYWLISSWKAKEISGTQYSRAVIDDFGNLVLVAG